MTLTEFLLERIAEDEAAARQAATDEGGRWIATGPTSIEASFGELTDSMGAWSGLTEVRRPSIAGHITRWDPARVLAECDAKRRFVEQFTDVGWSAPLRRRVLELVALPYVNHPDYDRVWRP